MHFKNIRVTGYTKWMNECWVPPADCSTLISEDNYEAGSIIATVLCARFLRSAWYLSRRRSCSCGWPASSSARTTRLPATFCATCWTVVLESSATHTIPMQGSHSFSIQNCSFGYYLQVSSCQSVHVYTYIALQIRSITFMGLQNQAAWLHPAMHSLS